jgi:excinuclease UvrABC ATPase subunit
MNTDNIEIIDAHENNLRHISLEIPKGELVVFCGVSGSGKSSLAFDTIANESNRQWQENYPLFLRNKMPHYDRAKVESIENLTPAVVVDQHSIGVSSRSTVGTALDVAPLVRLLFSRCGEPSAGGSMAYSANHPMGMCPHCTGLGTDLVLKEDLLFDTTKTLREGAIRFSQFSNGWQTYLYQANPKINADKKLSDFTAAEWDYLKYGDRDGKQIKVEIRSNNTGRIDKVDYEGVIPRFERLYLKRDITKLKKNLQDEILSFVEKGDCPHCCGTGLNPKALESKINGKNIVDYGEMTAAELLAELEKINSPMGASLARQISSYLRRMVDVGIGYLSFSRKTDTLSGGEIQRVKMVRSLKSSLTNISYIFDEPTAGLHPSDAEKIGRILVSLKNAGNSVFVVEHNRQMISLADHVIEMGEGAGANGGNIVFQGTLDDLKKTQTKTALSLVEKITVNKNPLAFTEFFELKDLHSHNLKHIDVKIPKGVLTAICGVAGSGKSSVMQEFIKAKPDSIWITQKPIGTSIRSTPATYTGVADEIRKLFAKENGVDASYLSFNAKGGCPACGGTGRITYDMAFAEPVVIVCEDCGGHRYSRQALTYTYKSKNIDEVMSLTVDEALEFFDAPKIRKPLKALQDVGIGYITLGQSTATLSGGEIQRIKLASELHKKGVVYILDEPSTGLHSKDAEKLLTLFRKLVADGNTVIIIEHRLELIAQADYIIEMGQGGGTSGGEVVFQGTPQEIIHCDRSKTGRYLKENIM